MNRRKFIGAAIIVAPMVGVITLVDALDSKALERSFGRMEISGIH